ncbi:hypothetical protein [Oricola thermophila]|uniref:Uncharacterized protein n=1 Tax=Oricola thermophila TaxID=2742145 RepID=A0A6N1VHU0_9HYPH|nr:hypothetical protein [Oricola thermophila]QKV18709.1 hypothetical protein HTY61_09735 [Oricola thermophila]
MPKMWLYHDSNANQSALRILRDGISAEPHELSVSDWGSMHFDSLNPNQFEPISIFTKEARDFGSIGDGSYRFWPPGTNKNTAQYIVSYFPSYQYDAYELINNTLGYNYPNVCISKKFTSGGWLNGNIGYRYVRQASGTGGAVIFTGHYTTYGSLSKFSTVSNFIIGYSGVIMTTALNFADPGSPSYGEDNDQYPILYCHLPLPADNRAWNPVSGTPSPGQKIVSITPTQAKVARPGYDVDTANANQLLIDSTKTPLKVVKSGQVTISANSTETIPLPGGINYGSNLFVDYIVWRSGTPAYHPPLYEGGGSDSNWALGVQSKVNNGNLLLRNPTQYNLICRYIAFGYDDRPQTSGGSKVLFKGVADGEEYIQIKKPGSAATPNLADVLVDSRFPYCPVIAEGYVTVNASNKTRVINFSNPGGKFYPYPIWMARVYRSVSNEYYNIGPMARKMIALNMSQGHQYHGQMSSDSCIAKIEDTKVTFITEPGNPSRLTWTSSDGLVVQYEERVVGIRYYILALPVT